MGVASQRWTMIVLVRRVRYSSFKLILYLLTSPQTPHLETNLSILPHNTNAIRFPRRVLSSICALCESVVDEYHATEELKKKSTRNNKAVPLTVTNAPSSGGKKQTHILSAGGSNSTATSLIGIAQGL